MINAKILQMFGKFKNMTVPKILGWGTCSEQTSMNKDNCILKIACKRQVARTADNIVTNIPSAIERTFLFEGLIFFAAFFAKTYRRLVTSKVKTAPKQFGRKEVKNVK